MPKTSTIPFVRSPPTARLGAEEAADRPLEGERLEAPLSTVPYPLEPCHGVCLDVRDVEGDSEAVRYRSARW